MSYSEDTQTRPFDVRRVNLLAISKLVDLEIVIAEADFCLKDIDRQIKEKFGDAAWLKDATRAKGEIEHKRNLAVMKRDGIQEARAAATPSAEDSFKARFMQAAATMLPQADYNRIYEAARFDKGARS